MSAESATAAPAVPLPKALQTARFIARPISFLEHWRKRLGETFHASIYGPGDVVFISDPEAMRDLFGADRVNTIAPGRTIALGALLGPGSLLLQEGEEHLRRRKLMLPPFHGERMRSYATVIREETAREVARWPDAEPFALHRSMQAITLEVILRTVFGVSDEHRRTELSRALVEILAATASARAVGFIVPGVRSIPPYRRLGALAARIDDLLAAEIHERRSEPATAERDDVLSMLVEARFEDGSAMSDSELRDQLITLLLAGHETTATALAWTFDLLFREPETMARLRVEIQGDDGDTYIDAVCREALRVRPVVPFTGRMLLEDASLAGYDHEAGSVVLAAIYMLHTRADVYPDPFSFRPERFLDSPPDTYSWIPFGGGTRRCIGAAFAEMEMRVALSTIIESVDLAPATAEPERPLRRNVTMSPARGTPAVVTGRV